MYSGYVLWEDAGLQSPETCFFEFRDNLFHQYFTQVLSLRIGINVDAEFTYPLVNLAGKNPGDSSPPQDFIPLQAD